MKPILFSLLFLFVTKPAFSQIPPNDRAILLDSMLIETDIKNYVYHGIIKDYKIEQESYIFTYYYKSGSMLMKGTSSSKDQLIKDGQFVYYYENGKKKSVATYIKNNPSGKTFDWYENGNYKQEGEFIPDEKDTNKSKYRINQFWNAEGVQTVTDGNGDYEEVGKKTFASGKVKNGIKDGTWEGYDKNLGYTYKETYENQKLVSGISIDATKTTHNYTIKEKKPEPKGGIDKFYRYIAENFRTSYLPNGLSGKVIAKFIVDKEGQIVNPKIIKSLGSQADVEAIRVIKNSEKWIPGELRGIKVKTLYTLPLTIQTP